MRATTKESDTSGTTAKPATKSLFDAWHELVAPDDIIEVGRRLGVIKRQRKIDLPALVAATIGAVSPVPGSETNPLVNYLQLVGVGEDEAKIALSSFYDRYSEEFGLSTWFSGSILCITTQDRPTKPGGEPRMAPTAMGQHSERAGNPR